MNQRGEVASTKIRGRGYVIAVVLVSGVVALYVLIGYAIYVAVSALL